MTRRQQEVKASRTGLERDVDVLLTSDQVGVGKPQIRTFGLAGGHLGVPLHAVVDVGDQLEADALAASAVGLRGV
jgi:putative hydrolase of the HAD superfamily